MSNLLSPHRFQKSGFSSEKGIRFFFASNAGLTIVILILIIAFLLKEGLGFFPGYRRELEVYRRAGLEFVDISRKNLTAHEQLSSLLQRAYQAEINGQCRREIRRAEEINDIYSSFTEQIAQTRGLVLKNSQPGNTTNGVLLDKLKAAYEERKQKAIAALPETKYLTAEERKSFIESLRLQSIDSTDDPPLVGSIAAEFAAVRKKYAAPLKAFRADVSAFESANSDLDSLVTEMTAEAKATKAKIEQAHSSEKIQESSRRSGNTASQEKPSTPSITEAEVKSSIDTLLTRIPKCIEVHQKLKADVSGFREKLAIKLTQPDAIRFLTAANKAIPAFITDIEKAPESLNGWKYDQPVGITHAISSFITGKDWITGGEWQDFYGILPLAVGSLMIAIVALLIAIPIGIGSAIYVNQFASKREQAIIKPVIEFIQAIPSVVLGFIGILVLGTTLKELSQLDALRWIPGFPIDERLNIFTAGCLLALMSIPTIFSLAEDAINNVPSAYAEASEALGASKIQTTFRVMIPAAFSGILAAILLGFGRVIGETMVVLLVAGNRIKIPDFSSGIGAFFQPAHTLTGIIAQELGEVPVGSVHYRALFVVGILLFAVVLIINATAHRITSKMKH